MLEKEKRKRGVTIGFTYEDSTPDTFFNALEKKSKEETADKDASDSDDSDLDFGMIMLEIRLFLLILYYIFNHTFFP